MTIYDRIKFLREKLGFSQQELAEKVGFKTASAVNKIELGLRDINQSKIVAFAKALNTTPSYLMGWEDEKEKIPAGDDRDSEIIRMFSELTADEKKSVLDYIAFVLSKRSDA